MSTESHETKEFNNFIEDIRNETDRAAVIISAAKLDLQLYQIIERFLIPSTSSKDELLDGDSPLGTFSSRILFCYRTGLITADLTRSLQLIRKIRNAFAHEFSGMSLNTGSHSDRVRELIASFNQTKAFPWLKKKIYEKETTPAEEFRVAVTIISIRLSSLFNNLTPLTSDFALNLCPPNSPRFEIHNESDKKKQATNQEPEK